MLHLFFCLYAINTIYSESSLCRPNYRTPKHLVYIQSVILSFIVEIASTFFFFKYFWRTHTHVLFWGHWYPCFGFLVTSPLGFKARVGSALFALHRRT